MRAETTKRKEFARPIVETALSILRSVEQPLTAAELAVRLGFSGNRETQRRDVRFLVDQLRRQGVRICADIPGGTKGYWLARRRGEWQEYLEAKRSGAKFTFVAVRVMSDAAAERATGQGRLFDTRPGAFTRGR